MQQHSCCRRQFRNETEAQARKQEAGRRRLLVAYASADDVNRWLAGDQLTFSDDEIISEEDSAERIIRGWLTGKIDSDTLNSWVEPARTPEMIREIAGQFVAAFKYRKLYAQDRSDAVAAYGQEMYNEALAKLMDIVNDQIKLQDLDDSSTVTTDTNLTRGNFYPNDLAVCDQAAHFGWNRRF